jgi:hypothetical protein
MAMAVHDVWGPRASHRPAMMSPDTIAARKSAQGISEKPIQSTHRSTWIATSHLFPSDVKSIFPNPSIRATT